METIIIGYIGIIGYILGLDRGCIGIMENKMETTILSARWQCGMLISLGIRGV